MESDSDYEVEESVVLHVEVTGVIQEDLHLDSQANISFIQVDSDTPLVQIGNQVYLGSYQDTVGTSLFLSHRNSARQGEDRDKEEEVVVEEEDPVFGRRSHPKVELLDCTRKKLKLKRVFLKAKPESNQNSERDNNQVNLMT